MAFIAPLKGVHFNPQKVGKLDEVVTPPYDVISANGVDAYLARNPYNMIRLDIVKSIGPGDEADARYQEAAALFSQWLAEKVLVRDPEPGIYLYHTEYSHPSGKRLTRKGFVALVGLAEFAEGVVKPHEQTFDTVIADRLRLTATCKAQFSQIFSLYSDPHNAVLTLLEQQERESLGAVTDADGCVHSLWRVTSSETIKEVQRQFLDKSLYIADGHHRYTTALAYRKMVREVKGELAANDPANHIIMYLCPMEDPGLSVLPTHRLLRWPGRMEAAELLNRLDRYFLCEEIIGGSRETLMGEVLARMGELERLSPDKSSSTFGVYHPTEDRCFLLSLKQEARDVLAGRPEPLRDLDVVVLSDIIIGKALGLDHHRCEQEKLVSYYSDPDEALDAAVKECLVSDKFTPLLFVMNPTRVGQVRDVADHDLIMPHKSTYFYPKIMTGLLFNQLVDGEEIERIG
ncbi:MAG: DUF1015 domain-containing protein [Proteobacteria bacterium]|nr:DUF1015 domain-containing protein [Pseudomonadota bacterium]MBU1649396.1 DUF1015 domain-containing protein [Pseudomonadota bacterium]